MEECLKCPLDRKLTYCCWRNPLTDESTRSRVNGQDVLACNNLEGSGECYLYDKRPKDCRGYFCPVILNLKKGPNKT